MSDTTPVKFAYSFVEYRGVFAEPIFAAFGKRDWALVRAIYLALQKWGLTLDQIVLRQNVSTVSDIQISFNLPRLGVAVQLSMGNITLTMANPDWSRAAELVEVSTAAIEGAKNGAESGLQSQQLSLAMHLTPKGKTPKEISSRYVSVHEVPTDLLGQVKGLGFSVYGDNSALVVDPSSLYADALFVRITRTHGGQVTMAEMAKFLENDEKQAFALLGIHEDA